MQTTNTKHTIKNNWIKIGINKFYSCALSISMLMLFLIFTSFKSNSFTSFFSNNEFSDDILATLELTTNVNNVTPETGEVFIYTLQYRCASLVEDCIGTYITDPLPPEVDFVSLVGSAHTSSESYNSGTHTVTFNFIDPLTAGSTGEVEIHVVFPNGSTSNATVASNSASLSASNASTVTSVAVNVTASAIAKPTFDKYFEAGGAAGSTLSYSLRMCNTGSGLVENGTLNLSDMVVIDTLPLGTILLDVHNNWSTHTYDTLNRILTYTFSRTLEPGECIWPKVTIQVPSPTFNVGDVVSNSAWMTYTPVGESSGTLLGTEDYTLTVSNPGAYTYKSASSSTRYPEESLIYSIDMGINGTEQLNDFCISDTIPVGLEVRSIGHGQYYFGGLTGGDSIINISYTTNLGGPYLIAGSPFTRWETGAIDVVTDLGLILGGPEYITVIEWCYGNIPAGLASYEDIEIQVDVKSGASAGLLQNCAAMSSTTAGASLSEGCADVTIVSLPIGFRPSPGMQIKLSDGSWAYSTTEIYTPGDTLSFSIRARNGPITSSNLDDPIIADLLPEAFEYISGSWTFDSGLVSSPPSPIFTEIENYNGTGRDLLQWEWTGPSSVSVEPGDHMNILFDVRIKDFTSATAALNNEYAILNETSNPCSGGNKIIDIFDLDGDGSTLDEFCSDNLDIAISSVVAVSAEHWLQGQLDSTWTKYPAFGNTVPGGLANYQLRGINHGNVALKNIIVMDILPFVGDTGVVDLSPRLSRWRPNLAAPVEVPAGVSVYYSQEGNPCRSVEGIVPSGPPNCVIPNWSITPPVDITTVQSIKFDFGNEQLAPGDSLLVVWPMRVPVNVLSTIGAVPDSIAWNSFAFIATRADNDQVLLASEPVKTGMSINALNPGVFGDYVWNDTNQDGIQNGGETGYDGLRVELFKDNGDGIANPAIDTFVTFTITANGGYYLFPNLVSGDYYGIFYKPAPYAIALSNQGGDDNLDSDGISTTYKGLEVAVTPVTSILDTQYDLSLDLGIHFSNTAAIGNYVWNDVNADGIQNESSSEGINGVVVNLYENSSPGVILTTYTTSNDLNGNPGYYLFDGLSPGDYFLEFVLPTSTNFSTQGTVGSSDSNDSDPNTITGLTEVITLIANQYDDTWDAALILSGTEDCNNGIDDDGDGLVDCFDTDCFGIMLNNLSVSSCIDHPLQDVASLSVDVSWVCAPVNDTIEVSIVGKTEYIDVAGGASSPLSVTFTVPADGITSDIIAQWRNSGSIYSDTISYTAPVACSTDTIACQILYLCGETKPADGDAWDHGIMDYFDEVNGSNSIVAGLAKPDASGVGIYDPNNPTTLLPVNLDDYSLIFISSTTEGRISSDLIDLLKIYGGSILNNNYLLIDDLGMSSTAGGYSFQETAYTDNVTQVQIYNYNNLNSVYSFLFTEGDYLASADSHLWINSGDQVAGINGIYFHYSENDVLTGISTHGSRTYLGYHMNGVYENPVNGGALPAPVANWFNPAKHLTLEGKTYFDLAILSASLACNMEVCDNGIDDDGDGLVDSDDSDCCNAQAPVLSKN